MQKEKSSRKTLMQNVNNHMDAHTDKRTREQTNGQKDENYIPLDIFRMPGV